MSGAVLSVRYEDFGLGANLDALAALGGDMPRLLDRVGAILESSTIERFDTGRAPDGTAWIPSRRVQAKGGKTLALTGRLRGSITHVVADGGVEVGTNLVYGGVHQFGRDQADAVAGHTRLMRKAFGRKLPFPVHATVKPHTRRTRIPARPYLGLSAEDRLDVGAEVELELRDRLEGGA